MEGGINVAKLDLRPENADALNDEGEALKFLRPKFEEERFPWAQIWGYVGSLILTAVALWLVMDHVMAPIVVLVAILALAVVQAGLQLGVFMHIRESRGLAWQSPFLALVFFIAIGLVGMSIWIMTFKTGVS